MSDLSRAEMEARRLEAAKLLASGTRKSTVARAFGVSRTTACRWARSLKYGGEKALALRPPPGRPPRLTKQQFATLARVFLKGRDTRGKRWTCYTLRDEIERRTGVRYASDHVGRLMVRWRDEAPPNSIRRPEVSGAKVKAARSSEVIRTDFEELA